MIELAVVDDGVVEGSETLNFELSNPVGAIVGGKDRLAVTIEDGSGANIAPNAVAGASQTTVSMRPVTLNGDQSSDPNGDSLNFHWEQTSGQAVSLASPFASVATFTAPNVQSDTLLQFRLTVTDPGGLSDVATTSVTVTAPADPNASSGGGSIGLPWLLLLVAGVCRGSAARSKLRRARERAGFSR
jgi:hypothetical protein